MASLWKDIKSVFSGHSNEDTTSVDTFADWSKFELGGFNDARSPCPMINALCNHSILPHDGRGITEAMTVTALKQSLNLDPSIGVVFSRHAIGMNPDKTARTFDLDMLDVHGDIEHDGSLSRNSAAFGDNHTFDPKIWQGVLDSYRGAAETDFASASAARWDRIVACREAHRNAGVAFDYGIKQLVLSYGETALLLGLLGDPKNGRIPVQYLRVLFEEGRVPYNEGWRRSERAITQLDMNHLIFNLIEANHHKLVEAGQVERDTVEAVKSAVEDHLPHYCAIM